MYCCKICGNSVNNKSYFAHEMMYGFKDEFEYFECSNCGCLQIKEVPYNLSKYYPKDYYSFKYKNNFLRNYFIRKAAKHYFNNKSFLDMLIIKLIKAPSYFSWFNGCNLNFDSKILDVGCGSGAILQELGGAGFLHLDGIDPYIENDIYYNSRVRIFKTSLKKHKGLYHYILLSHSFEHMEEPLLILNELYRLLKPNGCILIRTPVKSSYAWRKYGINWVQLDAPRHLFVHTIKSMQILAEQSGFKLSNIIYDSTKLQFIGSEQYLKDIPLQNPESYYVNPNKSIFSKRDIKKFEKEANLLNKMNDGDQARFYLIKC